MCDRVSTELLEAYLRLELDDATHRSVEEHVESCIACQKRLEEITSEPVIAPRDEDSPPPLAPDVFQRLSSLGREQAPAPIEAGDRLSDFQRVPAPMPKLPGYRIIRELGRGGMGVVYEAVHLRLNRPCAIKMILGGALSSHEAVLRLLNEAETVAKARHPHIVQIFQVGEHEGQFFLELEYIEGGSLARQLDGTPRQPKAAAALVATLASAINEVHRLGIVHRDLKPGNILLTRDGSPKIGDFGLAKTGLGTGLTASEAVLGSPSYMAPEQAAGRTGESGPAADVYSLGAVLYELTVGRPPFRGLTVLETIEQVRNSEPVSPSRLVPGIPRDLVTIILRCLNKEPSHRYESAQALAEDLNRFQEGRPILARRTSAPERAWRWCLRNPKAASLAALVCSALIIAGAAVVTSNFRLRDKEKALGFALGTAERESVRSQSLASELAFDRALGLSGAGQEGPALVWMNQASQLVPRDNPTLARLIRTNLDELRAVQPRLVRSLECDSPVLGVAPSPDLNSVLVHTENGEVRRWDAVGSRILDSFQVEAGDPMDRHVFSKDGRYLIIERGSDLDRPDDVSSGLQTWNTSTKQRAGVIPIEDSQRLAFDIDPGGRFVSAVDGKAIRSWDLETLKLRSTTQSAPRRAKAVALSPDGTTAAVAKYTADIEVVPITPANSKSVKLGEALTDIAAQKAYFSKLPHPIIVRFSPDGRWVLSSNWRRMGMWDASDGKERFESTNENEIVTSLDFSDDGRFFAVGFLSGEVRLRDAATGEDACPPVHHADRVNVARFTPDGRYLVTGSSDRTVRVWDLTAPFSRVRPLLPATGSPTLIEVSPDGETLFVGYADGTGLLWDMRRKRMIGMPMSNFGKVQTALFSPDGSRLLTGSGVADLSSHARVWDTATGRPLSPNLRHAGAVLAVAFSPNGRYAATGSFDNSFKIWDAKNGYRMLGRPITRRGIFTSLEFDPTSTLIITGNESGACNVWEIATGKPSGQAMSHGQRVFGLALVDGGRRLFTSSRDGTFRLWDLRTRMQVGEEFRRELRPRAAFSVSHDGRTIVTGRQRDGFGQFIDAATGIARTFGIKHAASVVESSFDRSGEKAITVREDGSLQVWDVRSGRPLGPSMRPGQGVTQARFAGNAEQIVAVCLDDSVRLIQLADGIEPDIGGSIGLELSENLSIQPKSRFDHDAKPALLSDGTSAFDWSVGELEDALRTRNGFSAAMLLRRPELASGDPAVLNARIRALLQLGKLDEADALLAGISPAEAGSGILETVALIATEYEEAGRKAESLRLIDRLIVHLPDEHRLRVSRARLLAGLARHAELTAEVGRIIKLPIESTDLASLIHRLALSNRWEELSKLTEQVVARDSAELEDWRAAALSALKRSDLSAYQRLCRELAGRLPNIINDSDVDLSSDQIFTLGPMNLPPVERARVLEHAERLSTLTLEPATNLRHVTATNFGFLNPRDGRQPSWVRAFQHAAATNLGALLIRSGRSREGLDVLSKAIAKDQGQDSSADHFFMGIAYRDLGDTTAARKHFALVLTAPKQTSRKSVPVRMDWEALIDGMYREQAAAELAKPVSR